MTTMTSTDQLAAITTGAQHIAELTEQLEQLKRDQDDRIIAARANGITMTELVAADGRSRQMLHRITRAAE